MGTIWTKAVKHIESNRRKKTFWTWCFEKSCLKKDIWEQSGQRYGAQPSGAGRKSIPAGGTGRFQAPERKGIWLTWPCSLPTVLKVFPWKVLWAVATQQSRYLPVSTSFQENEKLGPDWCFFPKYSQQPCILRPPLKKPQCTNKDAEEHSNKGTHMTLFNPMLLNLFGLKILCLLVIEFYFIEDPFRNARL